MQNTGTWNSDEAIFYIILVIFPIAAFFFVGIFTSIITAFAPIIVAMINIGNNESVTKEEDFSSFELSIQTSNEKTPTEKPKKPQKQTAIPPEAVDTTETCVIDEVILGLVGLGYKKTDARRIANKAAVSKVYKNSQDLLTEIISSM
tara:strand:- start:109 stop:549 length:441 start_codon:yes stop_codon:yes gene_type:complete